uniref:Homing endonuclease n=1 Tax=Powellomyces hirtus TaxID=109895 RepID=A0A4P8NQV7_9FUNG|nr:Homing endonuclease [Powellomyces hirtus]
MVLTAISAYLEVLPKAFTYSTNTLPPHVNWTLNKPVSVWSLSISNVDALHYYVIYLFLAVPFQSIKGVYFLFWCIVVHLHKYGYFYLTEGKALVYQISCFINSGRYSTNPTPGPVIELDSIKKVLSLDLPVALSP